MSKRFVTLVLLVIIGIAIFLRFYRLDTNPPSLYWDEVSLGYNAYSILQTLHDEHGEFLPVARFIAFGDYKPPGYIYSIVPAIFVFGLTEFAVRFPSAFAGVIAVVLTFFLARKLYGNSVGLVSSFLLAVSPWHLQLSRGAFEANLAMLFNLAGVTLILYAREGKKWLLVPGFICFVLAFYTFNANRITAPLLLIVLGLLYVEKWILAKKWVIMACIVSALLILPSLSYLNSRESKLRLQEVSIFTNLKILETSNERIARSGNTLFARVFHNRRVAYVREFLIHYVDHFRFGFLFISGDQNPRLSIQEVGELYLINVPFLFLGLYALFKKRSRDSLLLLSWMLIMPIPAGVARETPHALRIVSMLPVPQIIIALGLSQFLSVIRKEHRKIALGFYGGLLSLNILFYLHQYYVHYPSIWSGEWQYGYKEMIQKISKIQDSYDHVVITNSLGRPYIYLLFYQKVRPVDFWQKRDANRDWAGLWTVYGYDKFRFNIADAQGLEGKKLLVGKPGEIPDSAKIIDEVRQLNGEIVFQIAEL